ncbi:MAG: pyocin knob domain-containing protein, partial [Firmicutes bacterium]|nr:pyocin knob domain-containing protein [Bacillota bacterium]
IKINDGANGLDGAPGADGVNGADGADGVGIENLVVNSDNHLIVTLTDGSSVDAGLINITIDVGEDIDLTPYLKKEEASNTYVTKEAGKSLVSDTEIARLASIDNYDDTELRTKIEKKANITDIPTVPTKVSELENDSNYLTEHQDLSEYALKTEIPDVSGFLTNVPEEYITETELSDKGYLTEHQDLSEYAKSADVISEISTEISKIVANAPEDLDTLKEMSDWIAGHENDASAMNSAISDNTSAITELQTGKADKSEIPSLTGYAKTSDLHTHTNKTVLDGITSTKVSNWDSAKTHADSAHAPSNAQANVIETIKVNGTALTPSSKAVNVTVPTKVSELTDGSNYAKKTDIPTTLPANGGNADTVNNHTVKSDVPENAVFTDTIYDDTEVKESIAELNGSLVGIESALDDKADKMELNNYSYLGNRATRIQKNDDLNNYITPGIYTCSSVDIAKTLLNLPTGIDSSFRLEVIMNTGDEINLYGSQEMRTNSNKNFIRTIRGTGGWTDWKEFVTMDKIGSTDISSIGDGTVTGAIDTINTSLESYSIPLNLYMGINHYIAIKINIHSMNYSFNMSDRSGNIYDGAFFSYNGSFSIQITKVNKSSTKNGYILGFRQYKVSDNELYLVIKVSDYNYINGVINTSSILKPNIEILVNDDSTLWDNGTDIVVKELATADKLGGLTFSASGTTLSITDGTNTWTLEANS